MKLLFLDIDGVLNSQRTDIAYGKEKKLENLDPIAVGLLQEAVAQTKAIICLSSDWRFTHNYMGLGKELNLPILFETSQKEELMRGLEIQAVLDQIQPEKYAIIDDIGNEQAKVLMSQMDNLVKPESANGISFQNYQKLIELLS